MIYLYDNSFEGLLTAVFEAFKGKDANADILSEKFSAQATLLPTFAVQTDPEKADRVWNGCRQKISKPFTDELYCLFLAETPDSGRIILNYIADGFRYGSSVCQRLQLPAVNDAFRLKRRVLLENHRFKGLVRFRKHQNVYLADIRPDHNILPILHPHFDARLPKEQWILRDIGRKTAAVHLDGETQLASYEDAEIQVEFNDEYEEIWRTFFKSIAIRERINPRLQKQFMPRRYWENLPEKN